MHWIDPDYLPRTDGTVERFLFNPNGEVDGLLLADGMEVHLPPHLSSAVRAAVQPGGAIAVFGVRPRGAEMISAVAVEAGGSCVVDGGPPDDKPRHSSPDRPVVEVEGTIQRVLHGPRGEVRGALLADGHVVRVPPQEAAAQAVLLQPGAALAARGQGVTVDGAHVVDAKEIGATLATVQKAAGKPRRDKGPESRGHKHPGPKH